MAQGYANSVGATEASRQATRMEALGGALAETADRLERLASQFETRLSNFMNAPTPIEKVQKGEVAIAPGTIGTLEHYQQSIDTQVQRIQEAYNRLTAIL